MNPTDASTRRILVVEDEPSISDVCRRVLSMEGFEVDIAVNGKVAQGLIGKRPYALCLIDIRTPMMNGRELYEWMEEEHRQMAGRVIFTTGDVLGGDTQYFLAQTGQPTLPKPFSTGQLRAVVKQTLQELKYEKIRK